MGQVKRLTVQEVKTAKPKKGRSSAMLADGGNLYLQATTGEKDDTVRRSWVFRYELDGQRHDLGLGPLDTLNLAEAREKARLLRQQLVDGIDPLEAKRQAKRARLAKLAEAAKRVTFKRCVDTFLQFKQHEWSNPKHAAQWAMTLRKYAKPLHDASPADIDLAMVSATLEPIWTKIPETASRTRQRIEAVLDHWAAKNEVHDYRNPAAWERLKHVLPSIAKLKGDSHHPALPYERMAEFMRDLRSRDGIAARALEFLVLTAARTGDIIGSDREEKPPMRWDHVNLVKREWEIPSTKTDKEHVVPLSDAAIAILKKMGPRDNGIVFPGAKAGQPLSDNAMNAVIDRMNNDGGNYIDPKEDARAAVPHGFRSTFRDWAGDRTNFDRQTVEFALTHEIPDKTEAAYRRATSVEKRRRLMQAWATWCSRPVPTGATVTALAR